MRKLLAAIRALLLLPLLAAAPPAFADPHIDNAAVDELLDQLRDARSELEADEISQQIWSYWFSPSDPRLSLHMSIVSNSIAEGRLDSALGELTVVVTEYPGYAEGWNQRATVHYLLGDFAASLADIERVLAIEPRHYGAMAGRVLIYLRQDRRADALRQMIAALAIHPYLRERRLFPELARDVTQA